MLYLEDLKENQVFDLGSKTISKESIVEFAKEYDPQGFHVDEEIGEKLFGGLIASGWQTASIGQRLLVDSFLGQAACMASPGVDELRFLKPVYADDEIKGTLTILGTQVSKSKPDRGTARIKLELATEKGPVVSCVGIVIIACKPKD